MLVIRRVRKIIHTQVVVVVVVVVVFIVVVVVVIVDVVVIVVALPTSDRHNYYSVCLESPVSSSHEGLRVVQETSVIFFLFFSLFSQ